jgi:hypothetical protein
MEVTMDISYLYEFPIWVTALLIVVILIAAMGVGYEVGKRRRHASTTCDATEGSDVALASVLALLGLMLAFTYSFTLSRHDARRQAIIDEANAIGTAFLRADLAPEPHRSELRKILRDYAQTRTVTTDEAATMDGLRRAIERTLQAQSLIWPTTKRMVKAQVAGPIEATIVQSINEVLDMHSQRLAAIFDRLPAVVFALMVFIAAIALFLTGFHAGRQGSLSRWRLALLGVVLAAVITVITDFDRPAAGLVRVSHRPIVDLIRDMDATLQSK